MPTLSTHFPRSYHVSQTDLYYCTPLHINSKLCEVFFFNLLQQRYEAATPFDMTIGVAIKTIVNVIHYQDYKRRDIFLEINGFTIEKNSALFQRI